MSRHFGENSNLQSRHRVVALLNSSDLLCQACSLDTTVNLVPSDFRQVPSSKYTLTFFDWHFGQTKDFSIKIWCFLRTKRSNMQLKKNGRPSFANCITRQPLEYLAFHSSRKEGIFQKTAPLYEKGYSLRQIADETGLPRTSIRDALLAGGIDLKSGKPKTAGRTKTTRSIRLGVAPYGFAWLRGRLVMDPRESEIVRLIVQSWQSGENYTAITQQLNRLKRRTRSGGAWDHSLVRRIVLRYQQNPDSYKEALSWVSPN